MALLPPVPGSVLTQGFGPSRLLAEPAMYGSSTVAYWQPYTGLRFYSHFHAAQDLAAPLGSPILASEAGTVVEAGWKNNGGGLCVKVQIRPNVWYEHAHCSSVLLPVGRKVARGELIARVGSTGTATGNHSHFSLLMRQLQSDGTARTFLVDPRQFLPGGSRANDSRIQPLGAAVKRYVSLNGAGINIRTSADLDVGSANVYATSTSAGIFRNGVKIADLSIRMLFGGWISNDDGTWAKMWLGNAYRYCKKELIHFV